MEDPKIEKISGPTMVDRVKAVSELRKNDTLEETYRVCLWDFFTKLGWTDQQKAVHPLNGPLNLFYREEDHICSVIPYADPDEEEDKPTHRVNSRMFPVYLQVVHQIPEQETTAKERKALYTALKKLILERKRSLAEVSREKMLKDGPMIGTFLTCQEGTPFFYRSEEGNLLVDMAAVQFLLQKQPVRCKNRIVPVSDFFAVFGEEWKRLPEGLTKEYFKRLLAEHEGRMAERTFVNCAVQCVCGEERSKMQEIRECHVCQPNRLAVLKKAPLAEHVVLFEPWAEKFQTSSYDAQEETWEEVYCPSFSMEIPVEKAGGNVQDWEKPVVQTAVYDRKVMPVTPAQEVPKVSENIEKFFRVVCGGRVSMIQRLGIFFAAVMEQERSGFTVLLSKHHKALLQKTLNDVFHDCAVKFQKDTLELLGVIPAEIPDIVPITINKLKEKALAEMYTAQMNGRSLVLLKDNLPTSEANENTFYRLLHGDEIKVNPRSDLLPPQSFRNHLHFACVTDSLSASRAFADDLDAEVLDFVAAEQAETAEIRFTEQDLEWFRTTFLTYGLKLRTIEAAVQAAKEAEPPKEPETREQVVEQFVKECYTIRQGEETPLQDICEAYQSYLKIHHPDQPGLHMEKRALNKYLKPLLEAYKDQGVVYKRPHHAKGTPSPNCYMNLLFKGIQEVAPETPKEEEKPDLRTFLEGI